MTGTLKPQGTAPAPTSTCPTWAPAAKDTVDTALGTLRLWFTVVQGIVSEVCYPRPDIPRIRDMDFIVADSAGGARSSSVGANDLGHLQIVTFGRLHPPGRGIKCEAWMHGQKQARSIQTR